MKQLIYANAKSQNEKSTATKILLTKVKIDMPEYGNASLRRLNTCHPKLIKLMNEVIKHHDCTILCGARSDFEQKKLYKEGKSKLDGVSKKSEHQTDKKNPFSRAVDVVPYPVDWNDYKRFYYFAGTVMTIAALMGIKLRWGGDWDMDKDFKDNKFNDLPHFELID